MRAVLRKIGIAAATAIVIAGSMAAFPGLADARGGGGHHGGGGHGGGGHYGGGGYGGWGWGGVGLGLATGLAYGGYYGGPYAYDYGYDNGYAGECYIRRYWVINRYGHRVLRRGQVCY
jgi:hypothetical protein